MIDVLIYLRMSDDSQDTSIEIQLKNINLLCKREKYNPLFTFKDEGKSGSHSVKKRKDFLRMLDEVKAGKWPTVKAVVVYDLSRFGRLDSIEGAEHKQVLRQAGIYLHACTEGKIDWRDSNARIIDAVHSETNNKFSVDLGRRALGGKLLAFNAGDFFGFVVPYGLARKMIADDGSEKVIPRSLRFSKPKTWKCQIVLGDDAEMDVVRWMFKQFDTRDIGYRWLASELNIKGVKSPTGKMWHAKVIEDILRNDKYIGNMALGTKKEGKHYRLNDAGEVVPADGPATYNNKPMVIEGCFPAVLSLDAEGMKPDLELFRRVQAKIERRLQTGQHSHKEGGYLLKGLLYCGNCGRPLYGNHNRTNPNQEKRKSGKTIYVCKTAINYGKSCSCGQWSVKEDDVLAFLKTHAIPAIEKEQIRRHQINWTPETKDGKRIQRQIGELTKKIDQGHERYLTADKEHTAGLSDKLKEWKCELKRLQTELADMADDLPRPNDDVHPLARAYQPAAKELLRWRRQKMAELKDQLVFVESWSSPSGKISFGHSMRKDSFRQLLADAGVRVDVWWSRASSHRWAVSRVRLQIGQHTHFGTLGSEMV